MRSRLLLTGDDNGIIGCACARTIRPGLAEIKQIYVRPSGFGSGTGRALIQTLLADIRDGGYMNVRLNTGTSGSRLGLEVGTVKGHYLGPPTSG
jgi:N-acetylglutamate synthase-like GNAT family acetyltransferase